MYSQLVWAAQDLEARPFKARFQRGLDGHHTSSIITIITIITIIIIIAIIITTFIMIGAHLAHK